MIVAASGPLAMTGGPLGKTFNTLGATPKGHCIIAPATTCIPIVNFLVNRLIELEQTTGNFGHPRALHVYRCLAFYVYHCAF